MTKHYVEFHFKDDSVSKVLIDERDPKQFEIPEGVVKFRYFDTKFIVPRGRAAVLYMPKESEPINYSDFFTVQ